LRRAVRLLRVLRLLLVAVITLGRHCGSVVTSPFVEKGLYLGFARENTQKYSQLLIDVRLFFTSFVRSMVTRAGRASKPSFVIWLGESLGVHEAQQEAKMSQLGARLSGEVRQSTGVRREGVR
jgi:hypothetical protein